MKICDAIEAVVSSLLLENGTAKKRNKKQEKKVSRTFYEVLRQEMKK